MKPPFNNALEPSTRAGTLFAGSSQSFVPKRKHRAGFTLAASASQARLRARFAAQRGVSPMKKISLLLVIAGFLGCAPRVFHYDDKNENKYLIKIKGGTIVDTSFIHNSNGEPLEIFIWRSGNKHHPKDTVFTVKDDSVNDYCKDSLYLKQNKSKCQRSTEGILSTIRMETPKLRLIYNKYLRSSHFGGIITVRFVIGPSGKIKYTYLVGDTTFNKKFVIEIIKTIDKWEFIKIDGSSYDIVSVPFTFSMN